MADEIWVVRHGERADSVDPDWAAGADRPHDPPLTDLGRWAAWRVGRRFAEHGPSFDAVYTSPFLRCVETADEIATETGDAVLLEPGLGEHRNPEWFDAEPETLPMGDLAERFGPVELGHEPLVQPAFPERHEAAMARAGDAARAIAEVADGTVLLVGHGLTIGGVVGGLVGSAEDAEAPLCGLTHLERESESWRLDFSGDTDHLDDEG